MAGGIDELIDVLYGMVEDAWSMPLGKDRCVIEREKALDILDEIRGNLPNEIRAARDLVENRNQILAAGRKDAEAIRQEAQEQARQMVEESEIAAQAAQYGQEIVDTANRQAEEIRAAANAYCEDMLKGLEESVEKTMAELRGLQDQFHNAISGS